MPTRRLELVAAQAGELEAALAAGARAQHADGDLNASRKSFERAYRLGEQAADPAAMAAAALGLAGLWVHERRTVTGAVQLEARLQHVLTLLEPGSMLALRIEARLAGESDYFRGEHAAIQARLAQARAAGDPVLLAETLSLAHHCLLGPDHPGVRRELAVDLIKASFRTGRRGDLLMGLLWQTVDAYLEGDPHAGRHLNELRDQTGQRGHLAVGFVISAMDVMLAIRAGQLTEAEALAAICAERGLAAGDVDHDWWSGAQLVTIRWYQGRLGELTAMLHDRVHSAGLSVVDNSSVAALAVAAALSGDRRCAASSLAALRGPDLARLPRSSSWLVTMSGVVEAAWLLQDAATASRAYELIRPYADLPMIGSLGVTCFGSTHQALGVAALTAGRLDAAIEHLTAAIEHNLALAHWPAMVTARQRLAQACAQRGQPGDAELARCALDSARSEAAALGLPVPDQAAVAGPGATFAQCRRLGRKWQLTWRDRTVVVEDSIGMLHLAVLIANPRQEIQAAELVAGLAALGQAGGEGTTQPVLDQAAISEYRSRLRQLDVKLGRPETAADPQTMARARAERDWLIAALASAAGLAGRTRSFSDQSERARVAVGKAIRRALTRIAEADAPLGEHLRQAVHTGMRCSYWPG